MSNPEIRKRLEAMLPSKVLLGGTSQNVSWAAGYNHAVEKYLDALEKHCKIMYVIQRPEDRPAFTEALGQQSACASFLMLDLQPIKHETCADLLREYLKLQTLDKKYTEWVSRVKAALEREL